jgi:aryl carrier-like protein
VWPGAYGELFIGGIQVAAGYVNRAGLTATRFLPDPFSSRPGARMYRTGDIVRVAGDGTLDFLGRRDGQVKIRGFRIELGEIEAALHALPGVTAAAVEVRSDPAAGDRLVAHVVAATPISVDRLRQQLSARLPAYMIPARFRFAAALPTTTSGKLDRRALAEAALDGLATPAAARRAPTGPVEPVVAAAWSAAIGVDVTDADANFFALGGDSISSVAAVSECRRRGIDVAVRDIFAHPTVAALARVVRPSAMDSEPAAIAEPVSSPRPASQREPVPPLGSVAAAPQPPAEELALGPMQQYAVDRVVRTRLPGLYVVCFTAAIDGRNFDPDAWRRTWRELMRRHGSLRTSFRPHGSGYVQVVHADPTLPFEVTDLSPLGEAAALEAVAQAETAQRWHVIDITDAPQWRMLVFRIGADHYRIICRLSYLLQDGWSVSVLQDEWFPLYEAYRAAREPDLPPPPSPYSVHLRHLAARDLDAGRAYWRKQLSGLDAATAVTMALRQRYRPGGPPDHQTVPHWLTDTQEQALRAAMRREGLPLFPALQAAWAILLAGISGRAEVLFGTISSGRPTPDVRLTYGSFNNMMPTPVRLQPGATIRQLLHELHHRGPDDRDNDHVPLPVIAADAGVEAVDLLDTYIVHENFPIDPRTQQRFQAWRPDIAEMRTEHALRMLIWPVGELSLHLSFDARILSAADAAVLLDRYVAILAAIAERPDQPLSTVTIDPWRQR